MLLLLLMLMMMSMLVLLMKVIMVTRVGANGLLMYAARTLALCQASFLNKQHLSSTAKPISIKSKSRLNDGGACLPVI